MVSVYQKENLYWCRSATIFQCRTCYKQGGEGGGVYWCRSATIFQWHTCYKRGSGGRGGGAFVIMRHNVIWNFEGNLPKKACSNVEMEPPLQPHTDECLQRGVLETLCKAMLGQKVLGEKVKILSSMFQWRIQVPKHNVSPPSFSCFSKISKHEKEKRGHVRIMNVNMVPLPN